MKLNLGAFCFVFIMFSSLAFVANAASLYIDPATNILNRGDSVTMAVRLDTDEAAGECVNTVDATIVYSENIEPVDVSIGESILSIWLERPTIDRENRLITFAGGIPNGYCGRVAGDPRLTNILTEIVFQSPGFVIGGGSDDESKAEVYFAETTNVLLNDGRGTPASLVTYGAKFELSKRPGAELKNDWRGEVAADIDPPEEFSISLEKGGLEFGGKYYIVWNTTDKQTGIDQYFVMEEPVSALGAFQWGRADAPWIEARSPYVLGDQTLNSVIRVRAVDKAGNEYIATILPEESLRGITKEQVITYVVITFMVLTILLLLFVFWRVIIRRRVVESNVSDNLDSHSEDNLDFDEYEK
tara:strand:+ start:1656 stop:2726 length:1071 start_codon:yes stop_codon:yes gene_type:complete